jgi:translation initiation factor IF-2
VTSKKTRIHELAKEYGLTGQELAAKLHSLGFGDVKGPQSTLDEFQLLHVQGVLSAYGFAPKAATPEASSTLTGGVTVRKKKKRTSLADAGAMEDTEAPAEAPEASTRKAQTAAPSAEGTAVAEAAPSAEAPAPAVERSSEPAPAPAAPAAEAAPSGKEPPTSEPVFSDEEELPSDAVEVFLDEPGELAAEADTGGDAGADIGAEEVAEPAVQAEAEGASPAPDVVVKPASKRRQGKVVGFVDLSKVQAAPLRTTQTRKLRSKDDVTPDVQPTFGHDKKRALVRGDHAARGSLTAAQLREKESSRFLRRKGAVTTSPAGRMPRTARSPETGVSPSTGGTVKIEVPVTIKRLADALAVKAGQLLGKAMSLGLNVNINSSIDEETATLLALEFDVKLEVIKEFKAEELLLSGLLKARGEVEEGELALRPPTVAFLGHVDHGKTTLLDKIRDSRVAQGEAGGITQHIGAYQVQTKSGHPITIIDTPGHEAFTAMRARGAQAVDMVVLVVAADDGVMPSTVEAIAHAKAARTPMVVALNKIDRPEANPGRVKQQLAGHDVLSEEYGGHVGMVEVSALKGVGIDALLERIILESEVLELKCHPHGPATGVVLEAEISEGKGRVAFLLVKDGTLNQGDVILAGEGYGRVKSIHDDRGRSIKEAGPSTPVEVSGLDDLPSVGDPFVVVDRLEQAREVAEERARKNRQMSLAERRSVTAETLTQAFAEQAKKTINVILKADVQGSLEALKKQIESLTHAEVDVRLLLAQIGTVKESDVNLALTSNAQILAFHVGVNDKARTEAERSGVEIRSYEVIYEMLDELRAMMEGTLAPEITEQITGHAEVRALFKSSKFGNIAGSHVIDGVITRDSKVRLLRNKAVIYTGGIASLRREKDDAREVREGFDCGIVLKEFADVQPGDVVESFKNVAVKRLLKI